MAASPMACARWLLPLPGGLLNGAEFSSRLSEVAQTLDTISGRWRWARRALASWHAPRQESHRGMTGAVAELSAVWVSDDY